MTFYIQIILLVIASSLGCLSCYLLCKSKEYSFEKTELKIFPLEHLFTVGIMIDEKYPYMKLNSQRRKRKLLEFYHFSEIEQIVKLASAAPKTYIVLFMPFFIQLLAISKSMAVFLIELLLIFLIFTRFDIWIEAKRKEKREILLSEYPSVLTEIALMVNVGITAGEAFKRVAYSSDGVLYKELQSVVSQVDNGVPIDFALNYLTLRCPLKEIKKFISLFEQNLEKGSSDFPLLLEEMAEKAWNDRRNEARKKSELAEQKLLIPTVVMFIGILTIVLVPAFKNLL